MKTTLQEFEQELSLLEKEIRQTMEIEEGKKVLMDGCIDRKQYFDAEPKILWILKEAYGEGAGNPPSVTQYILDCINDCNFYQARGTYNPIVYITYGILKGKSLKNRKDGDEKYWIHMENLTNKTENMAEDRKNEIEDMFETLKQIAIINVKKTPGGTKTPDFTVISEAYSKYKDLLHQQIETLNPDVIICGGRWNILPLFQDYWKLSETNKKECDYCDCWEQNGKLYIDTYHPQKPMSEDNEEKDNKAAYIDELINTVNNWHKKRTLAAS
jgi:hypothetical protein